MIDLKTLKDLIKLMTANDLTELDLADKDGEKVTLKRGHGGAPQVQYSLSPTAVQAAPVAAPLAGSTPSVAAGDAGLIPIPSPMVGTFYAATSPDAKPFVAVGDQVNAESLVCIIEAMKVFNEIKAEVSGTVAKVLVSNGQAVEFGQPLFMLKPG